ncbi:hypothetical protein APHAL10511_007886 [Amanita phalloides]|nr:hypothetical protein APHAL10511_007886 [Amanita phalloides]
MKTKDNGMRMKKISTALGGDGTLGDDDDDLIELEGDELVAGLKQKYKLEIELEDSIKLTALSKAYDVVMQPQTKRDWKQAEAKQGFGYTGGLDCRKWEIRQQQREKEEKDKIT